MNIRTIIASGVAALVLASNACLAAASPEALLGGVTEAMGALEKQGLKFDRQAAERAVLEAVVRSADPLGRVITKDEHAALLEEQSGRGPCVGLRIAVTNGRPRVVEVLPDSPAAEVGIKAGDVIEMVESQDTKGMHHMQVMGLLRGPLGETVHLLVRHEDNSVAEWDVGRRMMRRPSLEVCEDLPMALGYVRMNGLFADDGASVLVGRLKEWAGQGAYGIVLDLRGVDGVNMDAVVEVASCFAESGAMLFTFRDQDDQDLGVFRADAAQSIGMPVMVLVDEKTSGAAEVLAAVLLHSVRGAMLIGSATMGDLALRETVPLSSGDLMYVATRRLVLADGTAYAGEKGLTPDILVGPRAAVAEEYEPEPPPVAAQPAEVTEEEKQDLLLRGRVKGDATLRRALDVLLGLKALNIKTLGNPSHSTR